MRRRASPPCHDLLQRHQQGHLRGLVRGHPFVWCRQSHIREWREYPGSGRAIGSEVSAARVSQGSGQPQAGRVSLGGHCLVLEAVSPWLALRTRSSVVVGCSMVVVAVAVAVGEDWLLVGDSLRGRRILRVVEVSHSLHMLYSKLWALLTRLAVFVGLKATEPTMKWQLAEPAPGVELPLKASLGKGCHQFQVRKKRDVTI